MLEFEIEETEDGDWYWKYGDGEKDYKYGKTIYEIREDIVRYVKDKYGNDTLFGIKFTTNPQDWHL